MDERFTLVDRIHTLQSMWLYMVHPPVVSEWMNEFMTGKRKLMIDNRITSPTFYLLFACTDAAATLKNKTNMYNHGWKITLVDRIHTLHVAYIQWWVNEWMYDKGLKKNFLINRQTYFLLNFTFDLLLLLLLQKRGTSNLEGEGAPILIMALPFKWHPWGW